MKCIICGNENMREMKTHNGKIGVVDVPGGEIPVMAKELYVCLNCGHVEMKADYEDLKERLRNHNAL